MNTKGKWIVGIIVVVLIIISFVAFSGPADNQPAEGESIKIGVITPLTGDGASLGEFIKNVIDMTVDEINVSGGVGGQELSMVYEDGMCTGRGGASAIQKLVSANNVQIVIGSDCSGSILSAVPIAEQNKVFIFSAAATSPELTNSSPFFARTLASDNSQGKVLAEAAIERGWDKVAVLQESSDFALGIYTAFEDSYQVSSGLIEKEEYPGTTTDFRSTLTKLRAFDPDVLFVIPQTPGTAERIFTQLSVINWQVPLMVNDLVSGNPDLVSAHKSILENALTAEQRSSDSIEAQQFEASYLERYDKEILYRNYSQAQYDLVYILAEGLRQFGNDAEAIAAWVRTIEDWPGISGPITIGADGDRVGGHVLKVIRNGQAEPYTPEE